jgi:hypothetical protein
VLRQPPGHPGYLTLAGRAGPAGAAGQWGGMGPGADARKVTDAEIIELSLDELGRFGMIFERHAGEILRYIHARLGPDLAQDVLAETFLAAFGRRAHYDRCRAYARPWLYGIAIRQIGRHRRGEQRAARALSARDPQARCLMRSDGIWKRLAALAGLGRLARRMCWWRGLWGGPLMRWCGSLARGGPWLPGWGSGSMNALEYVVPAVLRSARFVPRQAPGRREPARVTSGAFKAAGPLPVPRPS